MKSKVYALAVIFILVLSINIVDLNLLQASGVSSGLVAFYDFNGNLNSKVGNPHLFAFSSVSYVGGMSGSAVDFYKGLTLRATNSRLRALNDNEVSVGFWAKYEDGWLFKKRSQASLKDGQKGFSLRGNRNELRWFAGGLGGEIETVCSNIDLSDWSHVVLTGKTGEKKRIYVDGRLCAEGNAGTFGMKSPKNLFIGTNGGFEGEVDDFKVWNRVLSSDEVIREYEVYREFVDASCSDSDGGADYDEKGRVTVVSNGNTDNFDDICVGDRLTEYSCLGVEKNSQNKDCEFGCSDGACKADPCAGVSCNEGFFCSEGNCLKETTCTDSDNGLDYSTKGFVRRMGEGFDDTYNDVCVGGRLTEYSCSGTDQRSTNYDCPYQCDEGKCIEDPCNNVQCEQGFYCSEGDCLKETTCTDSDGGAVYETKGEVVVSGQGFNNINEDVCVDSNTLSEHSCVGIDRNTDEVSCDFGCENGACKPDPCENVSCNEGFFCSEGECLRELSCTDSDNGVFKDVFGKTETKSEITGEVIATTLDACFDFNENTNKYPPECYDSSGNKGNGNCVIEAYCSEGDGRNEDKIFVCDFGCEGGKCKPDPCAGVTCAEKHFCEAGVCVPEIRCIDDDVEDNFYIKGEVELTTGTDKEIFVDSCSEDKLTQYSCNLDDMDKVNDCSFGCSDGSCYRQKIDSVTGEVKYFPQTRVSLSVDAVEDDDSVAEKKEGWSVKYLVYDSDDKIIGSESVDAIFSDSKWEVDFTSPLEVGNYYVEIILSCTEEDSDCWDLTNGGMPWKENVNFEVVAIPSCTDDDGGENINLKGTVNGALVTDIMGSSVSRTDSCSANILSEFICAETSEGSGVYGITQKDIECANGCSDGACIADEPIECSNGCFLDDKCYPFGVRNEGDYCDLSSNFAVQKSEGLFCQNNFECSSNLCLDNQCVQEGLFKRFLEFLRNFFKFGEKEGVFLEKNNRVELIDSCSLVGSGDIDSDGVDDCRDQCSTDPNKVEAGVCGCLVPDVDSDNNGIIDCVDNSLENLKPIAPSGLFVSMWNADKARIVWNDNAFNEEGFLIERRARGEEYIIVGEVKENVEEFIDGELVDGEYYEYRVKAKGKLDSDYGRSMEIRASEFYLDRAAICNKYESGLIEENMIIFDGVGDGETDNYRSLRDATNRLVRLESAENYKDDPLFLIIPEGNYLIDQYVINNLPDPNAPKVEIVACVPESEGGPADPVVNDNGDYVLPDEFKGNGIRHIKFRNLKYTRVLGCGDVKFDIKGDFVKDTRSEPLQAFRFEKGDHFSVEGFEIDNNVNEMTLGAGAGKGMGMHFRGNSNYLIKDMYVHHSGKDGILLGQGWPDDAECAKIADKNARVDNVISTNNARLGFFIPQARNVWISNSRFSETGRTESPNYPGALPRAGLDIEPNFFTIKADEEGKNYHVLGYFSDVLTGEILIENTRINDNLGRQLFATLGVHIEDGERRIWPLPRVEGVTIRNSEIVSSSDSDPIVGSLVVKDSVIENSVIDMRANEGEFRTSIHTGSSPGATTNPGPNKNDEFIQVTIRDSNIFGGDIALNNHWGRHPLVLENNYIHGSISVLTDEVVPENPGMKLLKNNRIFAPSNYVDQLVDQSIIYSRSLFESFEGNEHCIQDSDTSSFACEDNLPVKDKRITFNYGRGRVINDLYKSGCLLAPFFEVECTDEPYLFSKG